MSTDAPPEVLYLQTIGLSAWSHGELIAVDQHADRHSVQFWNRTGEALGAGPTGTAEQPGQHSREDGSAPATEDISPVYTVAGKRRWRSVAATEKGIGVTNTHGDLLNRL
jgi:hypothetical protein